MRVLVRLRWVLLIVALICGGVCVLPLVMPEAPVPSVAFDVAAVLAVVLQALGIWAMRASGVRGWPLFVGFLAAIIWAVAYAAAMAGVAAGPGGLVYGLLIMLPGMALGLLLQVAALTGLAMRKPARA